MPLPTIYTFISKEEFEAYIQHHNANPDAGTVANVMLTTVQTGIDTKEWATRATIWINGKSQDVFLQAFRDKRMKTYVHLRGAYDNIRNSGWMGDITLEGIVKLQEPFSDLV